ncbi:CsxC family protein [Evansella sp. AB-rgal1]|uniref:CsxC family protein n=1 Tax=Evansella sp. AB-rgal1 TaxID=3242696 RepID=UPI00359CE291
MADKKGGNEKSQPSKPFFNYDPFKEKNAIAPKSRSRKAKPDVSYGKKIVKLPVVLAEEEVQLDINANIEFPEPVLEIKEIKKNLKITQCRLLLPTNKLFIKGFVRKNIQYATPKYGNKKSVVSNIRSLTIDVPFSTVTEVDFINKPTFKLLPDSQEFTYFSKSKLPKGHHSSEKLLSTDLSQYNQISGEEFNELPYCEIVSSHFIELDKALDRKMGEVENYRGEEIEAPFEEGTFTKVEEKMVVEVKIKVLQDQQVEIDSKKSW